MAVLSDYNKLSPPEDERSYRLYLERQLLLISKSINLINNAVGRTLTVAQLPSASANKGCHATVTDGTAALAWGATVTGGGSTTYLVWSNGTNWTVVGK